MNKCIVKTFEVKVIIRLLIDVRKFVSILSYH